MDQSNYTEMVSSLKSKQIVVLKSANNKNTELRKQQVPTWHLQFHDASSTAWSQDTPKKTPCLTATIGALESAQCLECLKLAGNIKT